MRDKLSTTKKKKKKESAHRPHLCGVTDAVSVPSQVTLGSTLCCERCFNNHSQLSHGEFCAG
jgi:hypothetical protein